MKNLVINGSHINMYLEIDPRDWVKFGVSLSDDSEYLHELHDTFFIGYLDTIESAEEAVKEFNTKHGTDLPLSAFHFVEEKFMKFREDKSVNYAGRNFESAEALHEWRLAYEIEYFIDHSSQL